MHYSTPRPLFNNRLVEAFVKRYSESNMTALVRIYRGVHPDTVVQYEGKARIARLAGAVQMGFGDEPQYMVSGQVYIPYVDGSGARVDVMVDDTLLVLDQRDPNAVDRTMRIMHADAAGQWNGSIALSVVGAEPSPTGSHRTAQQ